MNDNFIFGLVMIALALLWSLAVFSMGDNAGEYNMKQKAIDAGVATYYLDLDNEKQFKFLEPCDE